MRVLAIGFAFLLAVAVVAAQAPAPKPNSAQAASPAKAVGTLAQVMRGIYFPNANLLFDVQQIDPGAPKKTIERVDGASVTATFAGIYTGWQVVENAAIALAEATDLLLLPGRLCQNGKPVPVQRADYVKAAQGMRAASMAALQAAKSRNREKAIDVTNQIADACANCHEVYRDKGDADGPARCLP